MNEDNSISPECQPKKTRRALPYPGICRAKAYIPPDLVQCLADHPSRCANAVSFGGSFFCFLPNKLEIIMITEAEMKKNQEQPEPASGFPPQQPINFAATTSGVAGTVDTVWDAQGDSSFIVQICADPMNDANWRQVGITNDSSFTVRGLMSGTQYWFRVCALLGNEQSPWSDPALCMAP